MGRYKLVVNVRTQNVDFVEPMHNLGHPDTDLTYYFKVECQWCGHVRKDNGCMSLSETIPHPTSKGRRVHFVGKCLCKRVGTFSLIPLNTVVNLAPLGQDGSSLVAVIGLEVDGLIPTNFELVGPIWEIGAVGGENFDEVDLGDGEWAGNLVENNPEVEVLGSDIVRWW